MPPPLGGVEVPTVVEQALRRGLSPNPAARFDSMEQLIAVLAQGLLPDADSVGTQRIKESSLITLILAIGAVILVRRLTIASSPPKTLETSALMSWMILTIFLVSLLRARAPLKRQPAFRRLIFFGVVILSYMALGRTLGWFLGVSTYLYLIFETFGIMALLICELPYVGRLYIPPILVCAGSIVLQICLPQFRVWHMNATYILLGVLIGYLRVRNTRSAANSPRAERPPNQLSAKIAGLVSSLHEE
jgi:hypothetical protein